MREVVGDWFLVVGNWFPVAGKGHPGDRTAFTKNQQPTIKNQLQTK
jgi:hypothetical protein